MREPIKRRDAPGLFHESPYPHDPQTYRSEEFRAPGYRNIQGMEQPMQQEPAPPDPTMDPRMDWMRDWAGSPDAAPMEAPGPTDFLGRPQSEQDNLLEWLESKASAEPEVPKFNGSGKAKAKPKNEPIFESVEDKTSKDGTITRTTETIGGRGASGPWGDPVADDDAQRQQTREQAFTSHRDEEAMQMAQDQFLQESGKGEQSLDMSALSDKERNRIAVLFKDNQRQIEKNIAYGVKLARARGDEMMTLPQAKNAERLMGQRSQTAGNVLREMGATSLLPVVPTDENALAEYWGSRINGGRGRAGER